MTTVQASYFRRRAAEEEARASSAAGAEARNIHRELAERYRSQAEEVTPAARAIQR